MDQKPNRKFPSHMKEWLPHFRLGKAEYPKHCYFCTEYPKEKEEYLETRFSDKEYYWVICKDCVKEFLSFVKELDIKD